MKSKHKVIISIVLIASALPLLAHAQSGGLVPCGGTGQPACTWNDLTKVIIRVVNLLLSASAIVTLYYVLMSAWGMASAIGNPEKLTNAKEGLTRALIGFAIVILSFAFINLLVQGLFQINCPWWTNLRCLYP